MSAKGGKLPTFNGMDIIQVEPGHEMRCSRTGEVHVVDDDNAVADGRRIYMTARHWRAFRDLSVVK